MRKFWKSCLAAAATGLLALPQPALADDTDLFLVNPAVPSTQPNVLIILDNTANWSPMFTAEKAALVSVVNGLDERFNVGLMMFVETGGAGVCGNGTTDGSYVRFAVRNMTTANKTALKNILSGLDVNNDKSNNAVYGLTMNEARQYFADAAARSGGDQGKRDWSGNTCPTIDPPASGNAFPDSSTTTYDGPIADDCQKNFIIFISNGKANDNASASSTSNTLLSGLGGNTTTISLTPNGSESNTADEWARFLANNDQHSRSGVQTIFTYTVLVKAAGAPSGQYPEDHTALLKSMASPSAGKGKFFQTDGSTTQITAALNKIFEEVQAVNSVFASSTLPVSVNVRGTYLNQVYMGVFRPDPNSLPRWPGNLKQYKLAVDSSTAPPTIFLADKNGLAVENSVTGFVSPNATSVWTTTTTFWNSTYASAYYDYSTAQGAGGASDAPDGDLVEKGGAAQHLRGDFASGRTVYTCAGGCASSGSALTSFATTNGSITATSLGIIGAQTVTSLTRSGATATATTSAAHGFTTGQFITLSGANEGEYNGAFTVTVTGSTTFTYTITESPVTPATTSSSIRASLPGSIDVSSLTWSGNTATATTSVPHGLVNGATVTISGADQSAYNGSFVITTSGPTSTTFTYTVNETPVTPATDVASATATVNANLRAVSSVSRSGTTVTVTVGSGFPSGSIAVGNNASVANVVPNEYNGTFTITSVGAGRKSFTYTLAASAIGPVTPATGTIAMNGSPSQVITSLTRSGTTATATTSTPHGFANGATVSVSGADQSAYNGNRVITTSGPTSSTFTYTVTVSPASPASGSITASGSSGLSRDDLINWVRGKNIRQEDNPSNNTADVRGYLHGDVLHSRPAVFNYNRTGEPTDRDIRIFYGANDGTVHAVKGGNDDADGGEKWAFVLPEHFSGLRRLMEATPIISSSNTKPYFVDGPLSIHSRDVKSDGTVNADGTGDGRFETNLGDLTSGDYVHLFIGMRRGGKFIYALDVSSPDAPNFRWKKDNTSAGYFEMGQTWSELKPFKIRGSANPVVIFGLGYDPTANDASPQGTATMGRGVMVVDSTDGTPLWQAGPRNPADPAQVPSGTPGVYQQVSDMTCSIPADLTVFDSDSDASKFADRIYAVDTCGNVWRINIDDADPANWTVGKLAAIGGTGDDERKFLFPPDVVFGSGYDAVLLGSGDREHPFDTTVENRFYMFKDSHALNAVPSSAITETNLCDATQAAADLTACMTDVSKKGWFLPLSTGEKVVGGSTTLGGATFFGTNIPQSSVAAGTCTSGLGEARLYAVSFEDASPVLDLDGSGGALTSEDRYAVKAGGGFPPTPIPIVTTLDDGTGDKKYETVCTGTQCLPTPSVTLEKRYRIYWNLELE